MHPKLAYIIDNEGYDTLDAMLEAVVFDSVAPAICINKGCEFTADMEPDQDKGWCELCNTNSVQSALVIAGMI